MHFINCKNICVILILVSLCTNAKNVDSILRDRTNIDISANSCKSVKQFFEMRNISVQLNGTHEASTTCNGACCSQAQEAQLRHHVQQDFASLLRHNSQSLQGLLATTATTLQDHVTELARQSENKTLHLFSKVYQGMAVLSREPIAALYADIKRYIQVNSESDDDVVSASFSSSNVDIKASVQRFFTEVFPLVYHQVINTHLRDLSYDYKSCLREAINEIQPFSDIPRQISTAAFKSLEATRVLLQAFTIGAEVLNSTDTLLTDDNGNHSRACHQALLKMTYCPKCKGLAPSRHTRPCSGYCLNVLRGCLTQHVTELDSPWNDYVDAIERLVIAFKKPDNVNGVNADAVIRSLDTKISEAIMHAMVTGPELEQKVKNTCGHPKLSDKEDPLIIEAGEKSIDPSLSRPQRISGSTLRMNPPNTQLQHFLASVAKSRGFYANLADSLCQDESFAETRDAVSCWNGQRIGEYTETVVDASLSMQKYNPEVQPGPSVSSGGPQVARLADKLRHVRQVVVSALGSAGVPESDSYIMQGDAAEGSGSGHRGSHYSDDSDDGWGSGDHSGDGIVEDKYDGKRINGKNEVGVYPGTNDNEIANPGSGSSITVTSSCTLLIYTVLVYLTLR